MYQMTDAHMCTGSVPQDAFEMLVKRLVKMLKEPGVCIYL